MVHRFAFFALTGCAALAVPVTAGAAAIVGNVGTLQGFYNYDLEDINGRPDTIPDTQTTDWVVYGRYDFSGGGSATSRTTKLASSSFSAMSFVNGTAGLESSGGYIKLNHDGGHGDYPAATSTYNYADVTFAKATSSTLATVSFTHTILGEEEELIVYLSAMSDDQLSVDFSATVGAASYAEVDYELPTTMTDGSARNGDYGILALSITGAQAGDVLTFTLSTDYSEELANALTPASGWGVGIAGATATVTKAFVPEPASLALLGVGGLLALCRQRR